MHLFIEFKTSKAYDSSSALFPQDLHSMLNFLIIEMYEAVLNVECWNVFQTYKQSEFSQFNLSM